MRFADFDQIMILTLEPKDRQHRNLQTGFERGAPAGRNGRLSGKYKTARRGILLLASDDRDGFTLGDKIQAVQSCRWKSIEKSL